MKGKGLNQITRGEMKGKGLNQITRASTIYNSYNNLEKLFRKISSNSWSKRDSSHYPLVYDVQSTCI